MRIDKKSLFKVGLLLGIYSLHLIFIQVLMDANSASLAQSFKSFFSTSQSHPTPHQPVTHYYQQHKHFSKQGRAETSTPVYLATNGNQLFLTNVVCGETPLVTPPYFSSICDDAYRRYRLHRAFLI